MTATSSNSAGADIDPAHGGSALPIGVRLGDYDILAVIRHSGIGVVYEGIEPSSRRIVAIEEYLPAALADRMADGHVVVRSTRYQQSFREGMKAFLREARTLSTLAEPALVKVLDFWEQHGTAYMAVPLQEGRSLRIRAACVARAKRSVAQGTSRAVASCADSAPRGQCPLVRHHARHHPAAGR